nr:MAG TPA: hypothetical protein [Caudoviricetes sp.]
MSDICIKYHHCKIICKIFFLLQQHSLFLRNVNKTYIWHHTRTS